MKKYGRTYRRRGQTEAGKMNKTEAAYAQRLELLKSANEIVDYKFEAIKLTLAKRTTYTPDFFVHNSDDILELHEVKGHWEDDARVKIKVAAQQFPQFKFIAVKKGRKTKGEPEWVVEEF